MANETPITLVGRLVADPELRYTPNGAAVAQFRVASNPRTYNSQTNEWEDGAASFWTCNIWKAKAEAVASSLTKGQLVILQGTVAQRSWESREGEKRSTFEVRVDNVGAAILPPRNNQGGGNFGGQQGGGYSQQPQGNPGGGFGGRAQPDDDPWSGGQGNTHRPGYDDEPSF